MTDLDTLPERSSPPADAPEQPAVCEHCGDCFANEHLLALHRGQSHRGRLDEAEIDAYREARADERDEVRLFRLKALAALLALYFGFIYVYAFVL